MRAESARNAARKRDARGYRCSLLLTLPLPYFPVFPPSLSTTTVATGIGQARPDHLRSPLPTLADSSLKPIRKTPQGRTNPAPTLLTPIHSPAFFAPPSIYAAGH